MAARIADGFSLRGLSSVTITTSAFSAAALPISGRLPGIAVAAGAEHDHEPADGERTERLEHARHRIGLVGVVDKDEGAVGLPPDQLQPPGRAAERCERREGCVLVDAGGDGETRRDQRVRGLEGAGERQHHLARLAERLDPEPLLEAARADVLDADLAPVPADAGHRDAALPRRRLDVFRTRPVHVHHRDPVLRQDHGEQPELRGEIVFDVGVVVHVVAAEIGEPRGLDADAVEPALVEPVARCLERRMGHALARQPVERLVERHRVGRRQVAVSAPPPADDADRPHARRLVAGMGADLADEGGDRRLSGGAGHRDQMLRLKRIEARGGERQRASRVAGADQRDAGRRRRRRRRALQSTATAPRAAASATKRAAVGHRSRQRREQEAGRSRPAVGRDALDVDRPGSFRERHVGGDEIPEKHVELRFAVERFTSVADQFETRTTPFGSMVRGLTPRRAAERRITAPTVGAALRPAVAPAPSFSGFGSSSTTRTTYCGSSIGNAARNELSRLLPT